MDAREDHKAAGELFGKLKELVGVRIAVDGIVGLAAHEHAHVDARNVHFLHHLVHGTGNGRSHAAPADHEGHLVQPVVRRHEALEKHLVLAFAIRRPHAKIDSHLPFLLGGVL